MQPVFDLAKVHRLKFADAVDADGHVLEPADLWETYIEARYRDRALRIRRDEEGLEYLEIGGRPSKMTRRGYPATLGRMGQKELENFRPHPDKTYAANMPFGACDAQQRLALLDAEGLAKAVLYPTLGILWEAELEDIELSQAYCRAYNRWIADFCRASHGRLVPIAHLSLGDPQAAAAELARAVKDGCKGAFVVPFSIGRKAHGDPVHDVIWARAVELEVPVALHPAFEPFALRSQRFENAHRLSLLASVTAADGVRHAFTTFFNFATFDRFPTLKLVILESGAGWIGYWLDRLDGVVSSTYLGGRAPLALKPSDYFRRQCWISADPDERTVPALAEIYGADRFFWASDYPHPDHTGDYLQALEAMAAAMPSPARSGLLGRNVSQAYRL